MQPNIGTVFEFQKLNINCFKLKQKGVLSTGKCTAESNDDAITFVSSTTNVRVPKLTTIVRLKELHYVTFLYADEENMVYTFSIDSDDQKLKNFEAFLEKYVANLCDFYSLPAGSPLRQKISITCPLGAGNRQLGTNNDDTLKSVGSGIGSVFGVLSSLVPTDKMNQQTEKTKEKISRQSIGQKNVSKWQKFKAKCAQVNEAVSQKLKPVNEKCGELTSDVGKSFQTSNNSFIKGLREFSMKTQNSLNQGYQKEMNPQRASQLGQKKEEASKY